MSLVLGIDTATDVRVGLAGGGSVLGAKSVSDNRAHAELLVPLIAQLMADAGRELSELTGLVVGVGPGPFTGLRVGVAAAETLAVALDIPIKGVCTLDVVARSWVERGDAPDEFVVAADARRKEIYWAQYRADGTRLVGPTVSAPGDVPDLPLAGPGAELTGRETAGPSQVDAALMARHVDLLQDAGLEPLYLRRPDATVPTTRKSALPRPRIAMMGPR